MIIIIIILFLIFNIISYILGYDAGVKDAKQTVLNLIDRIGESKNDKCK